MKQHHEIPARRFTFTDILIVSLGVCVVAGLSVSQWQSNEPADIAIVHINHGEKLTLSMLEEHTHEIQGRLGNSQLEVMAGKIRFKNSPCTQRICVHSGWLKEGGEAAACLPNGISVVLHSDSPRYDSINF